MKQRYRPRGSSQTSRACSCGKTIRPSAIRALFYRAVWAALALGLGMLAAGESAFAQTTISSDLAGPR
ncbi:MAG TPA: hypothetical protein VGW37_02505, partial [Terriglobia bacterium]|nr:hypothetical protein [Terriglobia bacterium]